MVSRTGILVVARVVARTNTVEQENCTNMTNIDKASIWLAETCTGALQLESPLPTRMEVRIQSAAEAQRRVYLLISFSPFVRDSVGTENHSNR